MRKFLLIKAGTLREISDSIVERFGDQDEAFLKAGGFDAEEVDIAAVFEGASLPEDPLAYAGILITGSGSMVSRPEPWMEATATWLRRAVALDVPILGVCFGHQLLAYSLGGSVAPNEKGLEAGTVRVNFADTRNDDPLFWDFADEVLFQAHHYESVIHRPPNSRILACNDHEAHHALRYGQHVWGVQFHPELDATLMSELMMALADDHHRAGLSGEAIAQSICDTPDGPSLIQRFKRYALGA